MNAEIIISAVTSWVRLDRRVVAALICGSYARDEYRTDSDIDFVLIAPEPGLLIDDRSWLNTFGQPREVKDEDWGLVQSVRVFYGEVEVEFGVAGFEWVQPPIDSETAEVLRKPIKVIYDPDSLIVTAVEDVKG